MWDQAVGATHQAAAWVFDRAGGTVEGCAVFSGLLGLPTGKVPVRLWLDRVHVQDRNALASALDAGTGFAWEHRARDATGGFRTLLCTAAPAESPAAGPAQRL